MQQIQVACHYFTRPINKFFLILSLLISFNSTLQPAIVAGTLIKTTRGLLPIEELNIGDKVVSIGPDKLLIEVRITNIFSATCDKALILETNQGLIYTSAHQFFFEPVLNKWIQAQDLTKVNSVIDCNHQHIPCLAVTPLDEITNLYEICLEPPHTFFISNNQILTHNIAPFIATALTWLFGAGGTTTGGVIVATEDIAGTAATIKTTVAGGALVVGSAYIVYDTSKKTIKGILEKTSAFRSKKTHYKHHSHGNKCNKHGRRNTTPSGSGNRNNGGNKKPDSPKKSKQLTTAVPVKSKSHSSDKQVENVHGSKENNHTQEASKPGHWCISEKGCRINGRHYSKHALERMAPDTPQVRAVLQDRILEKGLKPKLPDGKINKKFWEAINPREIPPSFVEAVIEDAVAIPGKDGTWDYIAHGIKVILNEKGDVITVHAHSKG